MSSGMSAIRLPKIRHAPSFLANRRTRFAPQPMSLAKASGEMGFSSSVITACPARARSSRVPGWSQVGLDVVCDLDKRLFVIVHARKFPLGVVVEASNP